MSKIGFLITCYKQIVPTLENIKRIRQYIDLGNSPIIVVCTAEERIFDSYEVDAVVHYIHDAPGSENSTFQTKSNILDPQYDYNQQWRHKYLTAIILHAIADGLKIAEDIGCTHVEHLHSDTYWEINYVNRIINFANQLTENDACIYADTNYLLDSEQILPDGFAWHPEGSMYNLEACRKYNFGFNFKEIYDSPNDALNYIDKESFWTPHWHCIEFLVPSWLLWQNCGQVISGYYDSVNPEFYKRFIRGIPRKPHGIFPHGLINEPGMQVRREPPKPEIIISEEAQEIPITEELNTQEQPIKRDNGWRNPWKKLLSYWTT